MTEDANLKELVSALTKFLAYQDELKLIPPVEDSDNAAYLMRVLGIDKSNVNVLIGGSNCPIFHKAASEIEGLRMALERTEEQLAEERIETVRLTRWMQSISDLAPVGHWAARITRNALAGLSHE